MKNSITELKKFLSEYKKIDVDFIFSEGRVIFCLVSEQPMMIKDDIVFFTIVNNFYNQFKKSSSFLNAIEDIKSSILEIDPKNYSEPILSKTAGKNIVASYFLKFLKEQEIELICEIEKEKSKYYANKYDNFGSLKTITNSSLEYLVYVKDSLPNNSFYCL
jgi:hypothetical protein